MTPARPLAALLAALLVAQVLAAPGPLLRARRQLADDNTLQPLDDATSDDQAREKRKLEGVTEAKFGIKNAVLGFVFGKINSLIDSKTRLVETLDRKNIEINKQYGIEAPKGGGLASLSGIVGQVIGPKLQFIGPKIQAVTGLLGGLSGGSSGSSGSSGGSSEWRYVEAPGEHVAHSGSLTVVEPTAQTGHAYPDFGHTRPEVFAYHGAEQFAFEHASPAAGREAHGRHPGVRPQQGQPGLPGEPVWAIRVAPHPHH